MNEMVVRINGIPLEDRKFNMDLCEFLPKDKKELKKMKKLATTLWTLSGTMLLQNTAFAASGKSIWLQMQPVWSIFQDIAMVVGALALFIGLITFIFKRQAGKKVIITTAIAVGGCFLVPAALMLVAIIGSMINDVLVEAFRNSGLNDSVKVGG